MSFGGKEDTTQSQGNSFYDPTQTGLVDNYASGVASSVQPGSLSYTPYSGPGLNFSSTTPQLNDLTNYSAPTVTAGQIASTDLTPYENPYTSSVINTTNSDLNRQGQIQQQNDASQATASGAFGGSRSAVLSNLDNESLMRTMASTDAGLNQNNFTQAQQAAGQDINTKLSADQGNQQASIASATQRAQAIGLSSDQAQALFGADWAQYLNSQTDPQALQQLVSQAMGLVPTSPLQQQSSFGQGAGFNVGVPLPGAGG
jgi:hypothetical protein